MRKLSVILVLIVTLLSPLGGVFSTSPKKAEAAGIPYCPPGTTAISSQPNAAPHHQWKNQQTIQAVTSYQGETTALLAFTIGDVNNQQNLNSLPTDLNGNGIVDGPTEAGWLATWSSTNMENSSDSGLFLVVGTAVDCFKLPTPGSQTPVQDVVPHKITNSTTTSYSIQNNGNPPTTVYGTGADTGEKGINIGYYVYRIAPEKFFGNNIINGYIPVTGLTPGTTYYARIFYHQPDLNGFHYTFYTPVIEFSTAAVGTGTANESDVLAGTQFSAEISQSAQDEVINVYTDDCGLFGGWDDCFVRLLFKTIYKGTAWIMQVTGRLFDAFVHLSLESRIYRDATFVNDGWRIVRDLSNIFFIFILLYIAIGTILGLHSVNPKKMIAQVILIGLLINFSFFFTRLIIDAGNILAHVFYNKITVVMVGGTKDPTALISGSTQEKSLSTAVASGLNIQRLLSQEAFDKGKSSISGGLTTGTLFAFIMIGIIINLATAWLFFMCAAFFVGRIGMLWFSIIFAPLAFVSSIIPTLDKKFKQIGWSQWFSGLITASINAAIFMFFMYLIVALIRGGLFKSIFNDAATFNFWEFLAALILPMMIILGLMKAAKDIAKDMGGQFGEAIAGVVNTAVGIASTVALGGAALAASGGAGFLAKRVGQSETLANWATGKNRDGTINNNAISKKLLSGIGRAGIVGSAKAQRASFDVRNTGLGNLVTKATGVNLNAGAAIPGMGALGVANTALGSKGREDKKTEEFKKSLADLGLDQHKFDEKKEELEDRKDLAKDIDDEVIRAREEEKSKRTVFGANSAEAKEARANTEALVKLASIIKDGGTLEADDKTEYDKYEHDANGNIVRDPTTDKAVENASGTAILQRIKNMGGGSEKLLENDFLKSKMTSGGGVALTSKKFVEAYKGADGNIYDSTGKLRTDLREDKETGRFAEWDSNKNDFATKKYSLAANEAAVENLKTARQKDFVRMIQRDSGLQMKRSTYDAMGNIKALGRVQGRVVRKGARDFGRALTRAMKTGLQGALIGAAASVATGGGAALPLLGFLLRGVGNANTIRGFSSGNPPDSPHHLGFLAKYAAGRDIEAHDYTHLDPTAAHEHGAHAHPVYKTPSSDFFAGLLAGIGKGGGGHDHGGHDDHGGGHDDHGGGHH